MNPNPRTAATSTTTYSLGGANAMNFEDAIHATVTREEAKREIEQHHADWNEFKREVGDKPTYRGEEVLGWLGY